MNRTKQLQDVGQSLWPDNTTREILANGTLGQIADKSAALVMK